MPNYHWPGFKRQLLAELQKQQNSAQFCDTLLQTESISVPAHSCILAALSPYLSGKLSASASPPPGQKHQLQLQALKAQTLLKLVGLLYSGELEVEGSEEKNDVLSAACQFGITNLVGDQKDMETVEKEPQDKGLHCCRDIEEGGCERNKMRKMQDAQVQSDISMGRSVETLNEERSCVSIGTQTVLTGEQAMSSFSFSTQSRHSPQEPKSSLFWSTSPTQNSTLDQDFSSASCPPIPGMSIEASSDGASMLHQSSDSVSNSTSTSALYNNTTTSPSLPNDRLDSLTPQVNGTYQRSSERKRNGKMADSSENTGQQKLHSLNNAMESGQDFAKEKRRDRENAGMGSLTNVKHMQKVMEDTQISIKVKLRRRTKGETWEVVNIQNADDTLAVVTSLQEDVSNQKRQQTALNSGTPPSSSVQMGSVTTPHTPALQPATTSYTEPMLLDYNTTSDSQTLSSDSFSPNQNDSLGPALVAQTQGPVEDSEEQIEKLLEDIMMGFNILPDLERDPKKSHRLQTRTDQTETTCQVIQRENEGTESQMHSGIGAAGCGCYQEFGTQIGISSSEAGIHGCFAQPSCSSLSSVQTIPAPPQQQKHSPQHHFSVTSMGKKDRLNHLEMALFKNQNPKHDVSAAPAITKAFHLSEQKLYYSDCTLHKPVQEDQNVLEFLPLTNGNEAHSSLAVSVPCMEELRLRPFLSPLEPSSSDENYQPNFSGPTNWHNRIQSQPAPHWPPWLNEDSVSLQYPLSAITHKEKVSGSGSSQDKNCSFVVKQGKKDTKRIPQNREACLEPGHVKKGKTIAQDNVNKRKTDPRKRKGDLKCKRSDSKGDAVAPKRRKRKQTSERKQVQEAADSLADKELKVSDGTKSQINLSACSVSLSSNNVLVKERDMASGSPNVPAQFAGNPNDLSNIQESLEESPREPSSGIRTRSFLKKYQKTQRSTIPEHSSDLKTLVHKAKIENNDDSLPKRKRGRPRKIKPQNDPEISNVITEPKDGTVKKEPGVDNCVSKEDEGEKAATRCKKRKRRRKEEDVVPMNKAPCAESMGTTQTDINNNKSPAVKKPKRPRMVSLKEFQKVLKRRHINTRLLKESRNKNLDKTAGNTENKEIVLGSGCEETTQKTEDENIQLENTGEAEESHNIFSVIVDKDQTLNKSGSEYNESQQDDAPNSAGTGTSLSAKERYSVFIFDVLEEEVEKLAAARGPERDLHEGQACDEAVTGRQQTIDNDGSSSDNSYLPQEENNIPPDQNLKPQTPKTKGPEPLDADHCHKISGCLPTREDEEDTEVEVDVLLFSPDKGSLTRDRETRVEHMDMVQEEEEEDENEIDVTGDEAE